VEAMRRGDDRLLQRAEDDAMKTTIGFSRRQVGATRRAGTFLDASRGFVSYGLPKRTPGIRGRDRAIFAIRKKKRIVGGLVGETAGGSLRRGP
jgi:hypothetical protein